MARKSKFFRIAVEGATTDGRKIDRKWLQEIAKNYSQEKYAARIFIEHIRGFNPNGETAFRCQGDVIAVKTDTVEIDGQSRLALFAQIEPTEELVALTKRKQKVYSSIEVNPDFAGTGEAYLVGMGVTDSPASLGTEVLAFAAQHPDANPFATRKQAPENVFSAAEGFELEFEEEASNPGPSLFSRVKDLLKSKASGDDERFADVGQAVEQVAQAATATADNVAALTREFAALRDSVQTNKVAHEQAITDLGNRIDHTPARDPQRPPAPGGNGAVTTDC